MLTADAVANLNRMLAILRRSFPQYVRYSRPYIPPNRARAMETLNSIATEQDALAERVVDEIIDSAGLPDYGEFPMEFTDTHDLGIDYLIREAVGYQRQDIAGLDAIAATPNLSPPAKSLVSESVAMAKRHLAALEELANSKSPA
jgi:hypothetical protein